MTQPTIAIIGAGFSGTVLSVWLTSLAPKGTQIFLIERSGTPGLGLAYGTDNPNHLLNVPARRMSALAGSPDHFHTWLQRRSCCPQPSNTGADLPRFVARRLYGDYLRELLQGVSASVVMLHGDVVDIDQTDGGVTLQLASGQRLAADIAVLAVGNASAPPVFPGLSSLEDADIWRGDAWSPAALAGLHQDAPVLVLGTGLTAVDVVISLLDAGHVGAIHLLSRHGLLPRCHAAPDARPAALQTPLPRSLASLMRAVRQAVAISAQSGVSWHGMVDALRPMTQDIWRGWNNTERARFLRHLRSWWDVHRHRMPPLIAERIDMARESGQLRLHAGRISRCSARSGQAEVTFRERASQRLHSVMVQRVINCTGTAFDRAGATDPMLQALLRRGDVRPDPLGLGLDVTENGAVLDRSGTISPRLFAVGPLTKGAVWEMTAVPELREQCFRLAAELGQRLSPSRP